MQNHQRVKLDFVIRFPYMDPPSKSVLHYNHKKAGLF